MYYITKLHEANKIPKQVINYDNMKAVFIEQTDSNSYEVIGFGHVAEYV